MTTSAAILGEVGQTYQQTATEGAAQTYNASACVELDGSDYQLEIP